MDTHHVSVNPKELDRARAMWGEFARFSKYAVIGTAVILILMAIFLV